MVCLSWLSDIVPNCRVLKVGCGKPGTGAGRWFESPDDAMALLTELLTESRSDSERECWGTESWICSTNRAFDPHEHGGESRKTRKRLGGGRGGLVESARGGARDASLLHLAHVRPCSLVKSRSALLSRVRFESIFDTSQPSHYRPLAEMCVVRGSASWSCLLAHRPPGLKEEDSSPTRNAYKVRSFQVAIAAIHGHDKPIRSGQEAIKVRPCIVPSLDPSGHTTPFSYAVSASALPTE